MKRFLTIVILAVIVFSGIFVYYHFYYSFAEGNRNGLLIRFMKKGYVFKTYEGQIIQPGLRSYPNTPVATNDFEFSVADQAIADSLMNSEGKEVVLHYVEYFGRLPWRGNSKYVVDKIVLVKEPAQ
ncbi:MAG: hypothetical protein EPN37_05100 [Chitinophagaceae bacterium]|jgi:hypothetical protein|nr:MAG: hypothetical protein EPN37_05100 [Chitinophagaceae bacterium]